MIALLPGPQALAHVQTALLHSLWQGIALAVLLYVVLRGIPAQRVRLRYGLALGALCGLVAAVLLTWGVLAYEPAGNAAGSRHADAAAVATLDTEAPLSATVGDASKSGVRSVPPNGTGIDPRVVLGVWLTGVVLMLLRAWRLHAGAERLCRACPPVEDTRILALVDALRDELRIARPIVVRAGEALASPAVAGLLSPTLLLPMQLVTGLPPEQLRAVIAHELAHIRRYDYLVNFAQYIVEALLYFNPAVWWISRQIRIEREACCDAIAVNVTGEAAAYAEALAEFGGGLRGALQHAGGDGAPSGLAERVRRLLVPGYRPRLRWQGLVWAMLLSGFTLAVLGTGSFVLAGWVMSDAERVAAIEELIETNSSYSAMADYDSLEKVTLRGTVRGENGETVVPTPGASQKIHVTGVVDAGNHMTSVGSTVKNGVFKMKVPPGRVYVFSRAAGYAPGLSGPFDLDAGAVLEDVAVVLPKGIPTYLHFQDRDGNTITGVEVSGSYAVTNRSGIGGFDGAFGADGRFVFAQREDPFEISVSVSASGYAAETRRGLMVAPGATYDWVLSESTPITGRVVDEATGAGIAGAQVSRVAEIQPYQMNEERGATLLGKTDADGRYQIFDLDPSFGHVFLIRAPGYGSDYLIVDAGVRDAGDFPMGPRRDVGGFVVGDLSRLTQDQKSGRPILMGGIRVGNQHLYRDRALVRIEDGEGRFQFRDVPRGRYVIGSNGIDESIDISESIDNLELAVAADQTALPERAVVLRLVPPEGAPVPEGSLGISIPKQEGGRFPITAGAIHLSVPAPTRLSFYSVNIPGFYPEILEQSSSRHLDVPGGAGVYEVDLRLKRAGAIHGELFGPDGAPFEGDFQARARIVSEVENAIFNVVNEGDHRPDGNRFVVAPLPLDVRYRVQVGAGLRRVESEEIALSASTPILPVRLVLPVGVTIPVQVLDPAGDPLPGVPLRLDGPGTSHGGFHTAGDGTFRFEGVNPDYRDGAYGIVAERFGRFAPQRVAAPLDGTVVTIQLMEGLKIRGRVLEEDTDKPVPGVKVSANSGEAVDAFRNHPTAISDGTGAFVISGLEPLEYQISASMSGYATVWRTGDPEQRARAGTDDVVTIHVRREE